MSGTKIFSVQAYLRNNAAGKPLLVKSNIPLEPADSAIIETSNIYCAARVIEEVTDYDYDSISDLGWALLKIDNPALISARLAETARAAERKIAQAKALHAAKELLEASGLSLDDLKSLTAG